MPVPRNIYGVTKHVAEHLCELLHDGFGLPCLILRTSRFFPEPDDRKETRQSYEDANVKVNEFLYRRVDIEDVVNAHLLAVEKAGTIGFGHERARSELGREPRYDFGHIVDLVQAGEDPRSPLARAVGSKGYHSDLPLAPSPQVPS